MDTLSTASYQHNDIHYPITSSSAWMWKVRAYVDGQWGDWSETRTFHVNPIAGTCTISGQIFGEMEFDVRNDRGEPLHLKLEYIIMTESGTTEPIRAELDGRRYKFENIPAGKTYRIFPDRMVKSSPPEQEVMCTPNATHINNNFTITGPGTYE